MKNEVIKVKCYSPEIKLGDVTYNKSLVFDAIDIAEGEGCDILVLPELSLCGATLGDLLASSVVLNGCKSALCDIIRHTQGKEILALISLPYKNGNEVFSASFAICNGEVLGAVHQGSINKKSPLSYIRVFDTPSNDSLELLGKRVELSPFLNFDYKGVKIGVELGSGKTEFKSKLDVILNPASFFETVLSEPTLISFAREKSLALDSAYVLCNPGRSESTSSVIFSSHNIIAQGGKILATSKPFETKNGECVAEIPLKKEEKADNLGFCFESFYTYSKELYAPNESAHPFIPSSKEELDFRARKILTMVSNSLARRLSASYSRCCVLGISGGLDSTLALITATMSADLLGWDRGQVVCVTMPCFGTTSRTKNNAISLCNALGVTLKEVNIAESVKAHLSDIGHDIENHNVTYENAQARERTQVLMDIANDLGGIVVGTGDLSEVALGWSTYNGDQMSMYNVNSAIVKTLIRHVVAYFAENSSDELAKILYDILDTPVSPELLPHKDGKIQQKTEEVVGPYDLHDFFIYHFVGRGISPSDIYHIACKAFEGKHDKKAIYKWLEVFIKRFFSQHFKRTASPDGISLGAVSLSKGDFVMPSDMSCELFLEDLRAVKP